MPSYSERGQSGRILRQLENTLPAQCAASLKGAPVHAGHATARPLLQQICGRAFFQELNSAHKYKQPGHRVVSLLTLTSLLCLHVCRRQAGGAGARARWCGHSPLLCAAAALRGQKTAASLAAVFKCRSQLAGAHDSSQLTHAAADRTRTMPPESRGQCTVHKNQTVHEQLNSSDSWGNRCMPLHKVY